MKISPRYDGDPIIRLDGDPAAVRTPLLRQRRRLAGTLTELSPADWEVGSRCEAWSVQDVIAHLTTTDQFWNLIIDAGLRGEPTRFLTDFDPKATPAALVDAARGQEPAETLAAYVATAETLCATVDALDEEGWRAIAESPAGHVTVGDAVHHALWDAWIHERDVLLPLGRSQVEEPDEVVAALRYAAALAPMFALQSSADHTGTLVLEATDPDTRVVVTVADGIVSVASVGDAPGDALVLTGPAVELLEALSVRAPFGQPVPDDQRWLVAGLSEVFETSPA